MPHRTDTGMLCQNSPTSAAIPMPMAKTITDVIGTTIQRLIEKLPTRLVYWGRKKGVGWSVLGQNPGHLTLSEEPPRIFRRGAIVND